MRLGGPPPYDPRGPPQGPPPILKTISLRRSKPRLKPIQRVPHVHAVVEVRRVTSAVVQEVVQSAPWHELGDDGHGGDPAPIVGITGHRHANKSDNGWVVLQVP